MGCNESNSASTSFWVNLDEMYFQKPQIKVRKPLATKLNDLSREITRQYLKEGVSIDTLKFQIKHKQSVFDSNHFIPLADLGLTTGDSLTLQVTEDLSEKITLKFIICERTRRLLKVSLPQTERISNLRKRFSGTAQDRINVKILYNELELDDNNTLLDYRLCHEETLTVVIDENNSTRRETVVPV